jgi:energy-coupling factor transporter transmembrane protein EcfT
VPFCIGEAVDEEGGFEMVALLALLLILAIFGGLGFAVHFLWIVLVIAVLLWLIGFFVGGLPEGGGRRRWYGRW